MFTTTCRPQHAIEKNEHELFLSAGWLSGLWPWNLVRVTYFQVWAFSPADRQYPPWRAVGTKTPDSPQLASSDPSAQSGSSSQTHSLEMQCMEALHWNWSGEQVLSAVFRDKACLKTTEEVNEDALHSHFQSYTLTRREAHSTLFEVAF